MHLHKHITPPINKFTYMFSCGNSSFFWLRSEDTGDGKKTKEQKEMKSLYLNKHMQIYYEKFIRLIENWWFPARLLRFEKYGGYKAVKFDSPGKDRFLIEGVSLQGTRRPLFQIGLPDLSRGQEPRLWVLLLVSRFLRKY